MSGSSKNLDKLSPKQRALYELLLKEKKGQLQEASTKAVERTIPRRTDTAPAPASFPQQRLWVVDQLEGGRAFAYNVHITVQFTGTLDIALLERCVNQVVRRHESLRTVFAAREDGIPVQVVLPEMHVVVPVEDVSHLSKEAQDAEVEHRTTEESQRLFDLARGPLLRGKVLRLSSDNHVALVTMHHLVTDRWSLGVFVRELMAFYAAEVAGQSPDLPMPAIQYSDFAVWQRERMQGERLRTELEFWKQHLRTLPAPLELPTDRPRPPEQTYRGSRQFVTLPVSLTRALKQVSQQEGATLFMTLLSVFQTLMHRHSRQTDITVGSPIAGRNVPELEQLIGFFVNTLVLRNDLGGNPTFRELLRRAKDVCMAAYAHQELPFEKLVEELRPPRDLSRHPLFQVMFSFQNTPRQDLSMPGLQSTYLLVDPGSAKFDLLLELREDRPDEIFGWLEYNTDLFDVATVQRMRGHFYSLLGAVAANPDTRLSELPLLTQEEQLQLLSDFQGAKDEATARDVCLHSLIEEQVRRTPEAEALRFEDASLTYAQLDARANQLARHLRALGARPGSLVGVSLERSLDLVVALLAVLKSGAAYVPLDPAYPRERLAGMLEDTQAPVLLTHERLLPALPPSSAQVLCLDTQWDAVAAHSAAPLPLLAGADAPAYVIFTSGSTGRPKGAINAHRGIVNRLLWMQQQYGLTSSDTVLQKTPFSFDVSVWEFFWPLMTGARLVLAKPGGHQDPTYLARLISEARVTTLHFVPSMLRVFLEEPGLESLTSLRRVVCSGEALPAELVRRAHSRLPDSAEVHNLYGPTEAAVDVSFWHCARGDARHFVPIGRPVSNTQLHILDDTGRPTPVGVPGELFIGGIQVGLGYLSRPSLTAERFIPDAFSSTPGARIYRTGDVARWLPDGSIEYIGRADFQVKLRGFRIELGEIEAALLAFPGVSDAVVVLREDASSPRLVGYLVAASEVDLQAVRAALAARMPEFMVPSAFVVLPALPLSPNGKVDRKALPAPEQKARDAADFLEPRTAPQQTLATIWAELLGVPRVGIHDNFFELGGDSILAIQVVSRARQAGLLLAANQLFQHQTLEALARVAKRHEGPQAAQAMELGTSLLTPIQLDFFESERPQPHHFAQAFMLASSDPVDVPCLETALRAVVSHHDTLRLRFMRQSDGTWHQEFARLEAPVRLEQVDLSSVSDAELPSALESAGSRVHASHKLEEGLLMRAALFHLGAERGSRLLLSVHHLGVDGVSWRTLLEDLGTAYVQSRQGRQVSLPPKSTSFKTWASKLAEFAHTEDIARERTYWMEEGRREVPTLPTTGAGGDTSVASARMVEVSLDETQTRLLLQEAPTAWRANINDVLLTALAESLTSWTGKPRVRVDLEGHGREPFSDDVDLSRTVGWFTTLYPVTLDVSGATSLGDRLRAVRDSMRRLPRKGLGYGLLRHLAGDEQARELHALPRAQVLFNYLGQFQQPSGDGSVLNPFTATREPLGALRAPTAPLSHLLEINGYVFEGRLTLVWTYSQAAHLAETVQSLAERCMHSLRQLIEERGSADARRFTPTDFPLARLSQSVLDQVLPSGRVADDLYPLSPMQQGMLFHTLAAPGSGVYVTQLSWTFGGAVDMSAFRRTWEAVIQRQPLLRTSFIAEGADEPLQWVHPEATLPWEELDWRGVDEATRQSRFDALVAQDRARGFDLRTPPLLRLTVIRTEDNTWRVLWTLHHLIVDGWSLGLLFQELFTTYEQVRSGRPSSKSESTSFRDYIAWLQRQSLESAETYWRKALRGFTAPTPLPGAHPRNADAALRRQNLNLWVPAETTSALQTFARQHHLTLNALVQAAWALVLSRHTGEQDILFGATTSGRSADIAGIEHAVGLFINTLPVRLFVDEDTTVLSWLQQIHTQQLELRQFEHTPLVRLQGWSDVPRGTPLFESLFIVENFPVDAAVNSASADLGIRDFSAREQADTPLEAYVIPGDSMELRLLFDAARFESSTPARLLRHWGVALQALISSPNARLGTLSLLTGEEREQVVGAFNASARPFDPSCLHLQFAARATLTPDAVALSFGEESLTYRQLHERVVRISHRLQSLGLRPDAPVGLFLHRSTDMVAAMLGILHAGGAYLPLDPDYPTERLSWMLQDSGAPFILTSRALFESLPSSDAQVLLIEETGDTKALTPGDASSANLAYVIYTSGSTGRPKGVMVPHGTAANFFAAMDDRLGASSGTWLAVTSISFDISVLELLWTLCRGFHVVLHDERAASRLGTALTLPEVLRRHAVTHLQCTPSFARSRVLDPESVSALSALRFLLVGGEAFPGPLASQLRASLPQSALLNMYGPTETTVWSSAHTASAADEGVSTLSIGTPLANNRLFVLDSSGQPSPIGAPGELFISGDGVVRGYLGRPDLTAERFLPDALSGVPGARLYRTGDLARWRADGSLDFLGRADFQVKLRGFRIELGEVEAVLSRHPSVLQAICGVHLDASGDGRLVAWLVPQPGLTLESSALRDFVQRHLPEHMVPSVLLSLPSLPLTPNGKVDRKALPAPVQPDSGPRYVAPRSPTEELLAGLYAQVLGVERVGATDSFFALGGHSLLATQLVSRVRAAFQLELPLRVLFEAPTVALLAERISRLAPSRASSAAIDVAPIARADRSRPLPLSFAQQRLWFLDQLQPGSSAYNLPWAIKFSGALNTHALRESLRELGQRHEALRTRFAVHEGQPVQRIQEHFHLELPVIDLASVPEQDRDAEAQRLTAAEALRPFNLEQDPVLRATLIKLGESQHLLLVTVHHIAADGWSIPIIVRELAAYYQQHGGGESAQLPSLPIQYADFSAWQRQWLSGDVLSSEIAWWRQHLEGASPSLELLTDRPRPAVQTYRGSVLPFTLSREVTQAVKALAQREGATSFMVLLASFQLLLSRYSGQDDISVGSPIANRNRSETEGLIGFFVNTLVFRSRFQGVRSFRELLAQVRLSTLAAYEHQDVPFEKLVEELQPQRDLSRSPLFQVTLTLLNTPEPSLTLPGLVLESLPVEISTSKYDFSLILEEGDRLSGTLNYNTDLFDAASMQRLLAHFSGLLESVVAQPELLLSSLSLLTSSEKQQVLSSWNDTASAYPRDSSIHALFSQQAARSPDSIAVSSGGETLTYSALDSRSNQLAHYLRSLGVLPGSRVALRLDRSPDLIVALLAILKAGAAYVPLDKAWPSERLSFVLRESSAGVLVSHSDVADDLPSSSSVLLLLDEQARLISRQPSSPLHLQGSGEDLAYVMFTSGSTGEPKGVCIPHRGVTRLVSSSFIRFSSSDVWLHAAPVAFDASTLEIWGALLHGSKLVLAPPHALSLNELASLLLQERVSSLWLTAALFEQMASLQPSALASVSQLLAGGDALPPSRVREHLSRLPPGHLLVNGYGPTENTTFSATFPLRHGDSFSRSVPIGAPLSNSSAFVLDSSLLPLPPGLPGELFVGGDGLAWGYLNRPDLTAERFIPHPFSSAPGARLYRTGDLVRWLPDGSLEFLGRSDFQVKVRGFRIELGEVETALRLFHGIHEAAVLAREDIPGDKRLVAYFTSSEGQSVDSSALRSFLLQRLPEYMVPAALVSLPSFPLSPNGKLDRKALPPPDFAAASSSSDADFVEPSSPAQVRLASIFSDVLGLQRVSVHSDFFELGGHSLLATQVVSRIRSAFNVELPLGELFSSPTVALLSERLESLASSRVPALVPVDRTQALPLSFAQQRLWFLDQLQPGNSTYNIPWVLKLSGSLNSDALLQSLRALTQRHEVLRTHFSVLDGRPVQIIQDHARLDMPLVDLSALSEQERSTETQRLIREEALHSFDLSRGPLVHTTLVRLGHDEHLLLATVHHIVSDGWSIAVIVRELAAFYRQYCGGESAQLPSLPIQYADFSVWQRQWLAGDVLDQEIAWWRQHLEGASPSLELLTDRPRPAVQAYRGALLTFSLSREVTQAVKALAQREGATPFMVLLASFQLLLSRYSGQDDISVGSPIANRNRSETEGLIGFFVNTLVLRARLQGVRSFRELLAQVRLSTLAAYDHQDVPFEKLVEELLPQRDLSRSPLFQVTLTLQNAPEGELSLPGLTLSGLPSSIETSKYDFSLVLEEGDQLSGTLNYNTDLFDAASMQRLLAHFSGLLESVVAQPELLISSLSLLTPSEKQQVLSSWNDTASAYPRDSSIHALFSQQAARSPDSVAVSSGGEALTYSALDSRSNQLAHYLRSLGVLPGSRVALRLDRSPDLIVALLAILKAGAAYVPLDKAWPSERLSFVLRESSAGVLVSHSDVADDLPSSSSVLLLLDEQARLISRQPSSPLPLSGSGEDLAYVMFTSGSTGVPKGVCIPHRGVTRLVSSSFIRFSSSDVWLHAAPVAFDASTLEIWGALLHGSKLVLAPPHALSLDELASLLLQERVSSLWLTAALFEQMASLQPSALASVSQLLAGGDALPPSRVREHLSRLPPGHLFVNGYGPTENTTFSATFSLRHGDSFSRSVPIGAPLSNSSAFVLDSSLLPLPPGLPGELFVGGDGLAWGYLNRPDLTAERFVPHPFSVTPGARLYRTGDLVRWLPDGSLEFLGRSDFQVKVRGFRIELGEVEAALRLFHGIHEAAVLAREDIPGDKRLVAYFTSSEGQSVDSSALRSFLLQRLPEYMVPAALVSLPSFPLSPNGKLDRKALPPPDFAAATAAEDFTPPSTQAQERLASIFSDVLGLQRVSIHSDFFELGGHSLLATQVVSRIRAAFNVELPLGELFSSPTVALLSERLESLASSRVPALVPVDRTQALPLSFAQQRLWFLDQLQPGNSTYNIPWVLKLSGSLNSDALLQSLRALTQRHEVLRTHFALVDDQPVQLIQDSVLLDMPLVDLSSLSEKDRDAEAQRLIREEAVHSFDLSRGPLVHATLVRLGHDEHLLLATVHHIVSDGWSISVIVRELAAFYRQFVGGEQALLPALPIQYADFSVWQRQWLSGDVLTSEIDWWRQHLEGASPSLELLTDSPRPAVQTYRGAVLPVSLPRELSHAVKALAQREGATPFMVLLASFQLLLSRYSGQDDVSVGSPIANRNRSETEGLIGFFVNTLVFRSRFQGVRSFRELLAQVRLNTLAAYEHQDVPFEKLVEELQPQRDLSRSPFFQVTLTLQNAPEGELSLPGLTLSGLPSSIETSKYDFSLLLEEASQGFIGLLNYNTDLFDAASMQRLLAHFSGLLESVVAQPELLLSSLSLLTSSEKQQVLSSWNDTASAYPRDSSIHALFSQQAARSPDSIAVSSGGETLTYSALDSRSNQLAHYLRSLGVLPGSRVALRLDRSPDLIVALLAILKAGAAYVPLDKAWPSERLSFVLRESSAGVLVSHSDVADDLPSSSSVLLLLDEQARLISRQPSSPLPLSGSGEDLAYVMFTSGSTGVPKGVCIPHRGVTRLVSSSFIRFSSSDVWLHAAPVAFDASTLEIWGALLHGSKLVLAPPHALSLDELASLLLQERISSLWLTAALFEQMASLQPSALASVSQLLAGGDALPPSRVREHLSRLPPGHLLVNGYGPTENTTFSATFPLRHGDSFSRSVPIGAPLSNSSAFVLDSSLLPLPPGLPGELFVGGDGLAWGYLNRPDLTAERFIPHPFSSAPGARLYRTGDLVRWLPDGSLEFLGRSDFQVKVRGFRIELGEVEAALRLFHGIHEAAVLAREDIPGDKRLVAYFTSSEGQSVDSSALRSFLLQRLPEYMVPAALVSLPSFPLSPNGKLDRKALPPPDFAAAASSDADFVEPSSPAQVRLASIFSDVLGLQRVSVHSDFFELGGHSLLATQVVSRIRAAFNVELPLGELFSSPTVALLSERLESLASSRVPALVPVDRTQALPLSFAQQRLWFLDQLQPGNSTYNIPWVLKLSGSLNSDALLQSLRALTQRHEVLRTHFALVDDQPVQLIQDSVLLDMPLVDLSSLSEKDRDAEAQRLIREEAVHSFDLSRGPLVHATLVRLGHDEHLLLATVHHIVSDGWSISVIVRELAAFYRQFVGGEQALLPALPIQYADFSVWQRQWLSGDVLTSEIDWWRQHLEGASPSLELLTDSPRPAVQTYRGAVLPVSLPRELSHAVKALAQREGATPFMVLLASFQLLLSRYSGQDDVSVGSPIANRNRSETEGLIGFFVNTLVFRSRFQGVRSFRELLAQVRLNTLAAYEHQDVPFEKLVEELQPQRDLSRSPFFQVTLTLQNAPEGELSLPGLTLSGLPSSIETSKYDFSLLLEEASQGFIGLLNYNTDLFDAASMQRLLAHFSGLLESVVAQPELLLSSLSLLTSSEKQQVLSSWNDTASAYPRDSSIHALFSQQAARSPDSIAVSSGGETLTYSALDSRSNQLAHYLRSLGVLPGSRVALRLDRSPDLIVALLAILKAGAAYVPLDKAWPSERLSFVLRESSAGVLVSHSDVADDLPSSSSVLLLLDEQARLISRQPSSPLPLSGSGEDLAYVMFTSGSTGVPKGVCIPHRGVTRLVSSSFIRFSSSDVWLHAAPVAFDASTLEIWGPSSTARSSSSPLLTLSPSTSSLLSSSRSASLLSG
ncbi:non-ribosomal peptide synthase/polyketide synthase [Myxococcus landrumensis]|uniref:Non-ribosomal peptide synthase/polyketide synthase n=1 Tax=Myxococcus landrumensis TaxID=2813577 RepID=A0ABX7NC93_9BACT|nr:non-ribosomal peptide synthase/polyketide synthase [Myxococcus landrumus]QSQ16101.1 non-ribosomal peptide synthase/polyketide synthase [Myxococcus landrumus]